MRRSQMAPAERQWRAQLSKEVHWREYLRGTISFRKGMCGNPGCKCRRGERHEHLVLEQSDNGKRRQLYIPKEWEGRVRGWVKEYREILKLLDKVSDIHWRKLKTREG